MTTGKILSSAIISALLLSCGGGENKAIIVRSGDSSKRLIQVLMQPDPDWKSRNHLYAAKYLGKRRERSAVNVLIQTAIHPDIRVVRQALLSMGMIGQEHPDLRRKIARAIDPFLSPPATRDTAEKALRLWEK